MINRDDVIRIARESDLWMNSENKSAAIERFANLIASHVAEQCARELSSSNQDLMLMCGEMTAQELRTTQAVLKAKAEAIRSLYKPTA